MVVEYWIYNIGIYPDDPNMLVGKATGNQEFSSNEDRGAFFLDCLVRPGSSSGRWRYRSMRRMRITLAGGDRQIDGIHSDWASEIG